MASVHTSQPHQPWNKGKLVGQKAPLKLKDIWAIRSVCSYATRSVTWRFSIWRSIPSFVPAIWSNSGFLTLPMAA